MSNKKFTDLTELASGAISADDLFAVVDVSDDTDDATGTSKKIKLSSLISAVTPTLQWVDLSGSVDGVNTVFVLASKPNGVAAVALARQLQFETLDYTYDGNLTIDFLTPPDASLSTEPLKALIY